MPARVQVVVEAQDEASGVLRAIAGQFGALGPVVEEVTAAHVNWGNVATAAGTMVINALKDAVNVTMQYAGEVRDLALITGTGAEETSRMLQVLDDFEIGAGDVETAVRKMTQQGLTPNLETLAQLSDQYRAIQDPMERNKFILDNLGRSGLQWVNVLNQGGDALRNMGDEVNANLILTDAEIKKTEEYRLALDNWQDTMDGIKVTAGLEAIKVLTDAMQVLSTYLNRNDTEIEKNQNKWTSWVGILIPAVRGLETLFDIIDANNFRKLEEDQAAVDEKFTLLTDHSEALAGGLDMVAGSAALTAEQIKALEQETSNYYKSLISSIESAQKETDRYTGKAADLNAQIKEQKAVIAELTQKYGANSDQVKNAQKKLDDLTAELKDNEAAHKKWAAQTVYSFAEARLAADGYTQAEGEALIKLGEHLGIFDQQTADMMRSVNENFANIDDLEIQTNSGEVYGQIDSMVNQLTNLTSHPWNVIVSLTLEGWEDVPWNIPRPPSTSPVTPIQSGGRVYAGGRYVVGEAGPEPFFPTQDGRVLGHAESLHALSLGGGGGMTNIFYGPVTFEPGSEGGGDLLTMR